MILKIERYTEEQHWWILDNIRKVSVSQKLLKRPECEPFTEVMIFDLPNYQCTCIKNTDECPDCKPYIRLVCRKTDGEEFAVAFDTIAYILNDDGKTIEKIVANYKA